MGEIGGYIFTNQTKEVGSGDGGGYTSTNQTNTSGFKSSSLVLIIEDLERLAEIKIYFKPAKYISFILQKGKEKSKKNNPFH